MVRRQWRPVKAPLSKALKSGKEQVSQSKHVCGTHTHSMDGKNRYSLPILGKAAIDSDLNAPLL